MYCIHTIQYIIIHVYCMYCTCKCIAYTYIQYIYMYMYCMYIHVCEYNIVFMYNTQHSQQYLAEQKRQSEQLMQNLQKVN